MYTLGSRKYKKKTPALFFNSLMRNASLVETGIPPAATTFYMNHFSCDVRYFLLLDQKCRFPESSDQKPNLLLFLESIRPFIWKKKTESLPETCRQSWKYFSCIWEPSHKIQRLSSICLKPILTSKINNVFSRIVQRKKEKILSTWRRKD